MQRHAFLLAILSAFLCILPACPAAPSAGRQHLLMDAGWRFHRGDLPSPGDQEISGWRWKAARPGAPAADYLGPNVDTRGPGWSEVVTGADVFRGHPGLAWFRAALPDPGGQGARLHFEGVNDNATVYVNGKILAYHAGWDQPFDVPLGDAWRPGGPHVLAVRVENTQSKGWLGAVDLIRPVADARSGPAAVPYDDSGWQSVHLPHDYVIDGTIDRRANKNHGFLPVQIGWYRKTFTVPKADAGRRIYVDFDGVYRNSEVWLNGHFLGTHPSGYTGFEYDATPAIRFGGRNVLAVRVDPRHFEGWWYEGGGIYRHVWLVKTAPLHIAHWGTFVISTIPGGDKSHPALADLTVKTTLQNSGAQRARCRLVSEIIAPDGTQAVSGALRRVVKAASAQESVQHFALVQPQLWSLEQPRLYHLVTKVVQNGRTIDSVTTPFGIRTIAFDPGRGFFLNGKHVEIQGTCNHQNFAVVGTALPDTLLDWRIRKLKALGANAYRTAHDPQAEALLDACDKRGMLVMDENRHFGDTYDEKSKPGTPYSDLSDLRSMVMRDRNHPSIILWSMCNEEPLAHTAEGARIMQAMMRVTKSIDPTRPITCAMLPPWGVGLSRVEDIQGCNHGIGCLDAFHRNFPGQPMFGSEMAGAVTDRGVYETDAAQGFVDSYSLKRTAEAAWKTAAERPFMAGTFVWAGFDYQGEPGVTDWPSISTHFGMLDICGFPKDTAYYYKAWWGDQPLVHLFPHWNWPGKEGQPITVWCYSNCDTVTLLLNGRGLGTKEMPRDGHLAWDVPYAPGTLEAQGYRNGKLVAQERVVTTGAPAQIRLTAETLPFRANGEDLALVQAAVLDQAGRVVPTADNVLRFAVHGPATLAGTGSGNPNDHTRNMSPARRAFSGLCLAVLRAGDAPGDVVVTVASPGLPPARITLHEK